MNFDKFEGFVFHIQRILNITEYRRLLIGCVLLLYAMEPVVENIAQV